MKASPKNLDAIKGYFKAFFIKQKDFHFGKKLTALQECFCLPRIVCWSVEYHPIPETKKQRAITS